MCAQDTSNIGQLATVDNFQSEGLLHFLVLATFTEQLELNKNSALFRVLIGKSDASFPAFAQQSIALSKLRNQVCCSNTLSHDRLGILTFQDISKCNSAHDGFICSYPPPPHPNQCDLLCLFQGLKSGWKVAIVMLMCLLGILVAIITVSVELGHTLQF